MSDTTPPSLLKRLHDHPADEEAWQQLCALCHPFLTRWCARIGGVSGDDAADVVQNVLLVLVRKLPAFERRGPGSFRAWMKDILKKCLSDYRRKLPRYVVANTGSWSLLEQLEDPASSISVLFEREHQESLTRQLMELGKNRFSPETWLIFQRVTLGGESALDVARDLSKTPESIYFAKSHVLRWLRETGRDLVDE